MGWRKSKRVGVFTVTGQVSMNRAHKHSPVPCYGATHFSIWIGNHQGKTQGPQNRWLNRETRSLGVGLDRSDAYGGWFGNFLGLVHTHKLLCINYTSLAKLYNLLK